MELDVQCVEKKENLLKQQEEVKKRLEKENITITYSEIAKEWNYEKNCGMKPEDFTPISGTRVWWKCSKCGYEWNIKISSRYIKGNGCQKCAGNKIWEEYNDNINSINHYTKPAELGEGHDIIRPILWDYIIKYSVINSEKHNIIQFSRGCDELYDIEFSENAYFHSIKGFINDLQNSDNCIIVNLVSSLELRKNRNKIRFENGGHYVSDETMNNVYSKDIFEYTKIGDNFGYLIVDDKIIPVYTIVNNKTLNEFEMNEFLEYNVNEVIKYYNDFKEDKYGIKKNSKRYLAK